MWTPKDPSLMTQEEVILLRSLAQTEIAEQTDRTKRLFEKERSVTHTFVSYHRWIRSDIGLLAVMQDINGGMLGGIAWLR